MKALFLILWVIASSAQAGDIYKWTDAQGRVHYGDAPEDKDKAEKLEPKINSYEAVSYDNIEYYQSAKSQQVLMYSTSWCGYCKKARRYFKQQGIAYTEYDIEKNSAAKRDYDRLGGRGVPVIVVGDKRMNGFTVAGFERIYK
ncbi:glutaredoxin [Alteromonadaceae bacterium 2753L.S.0a.02]|nr:glutaredoxin [Alteromonadaceae bacterium 2753L.S.0a.02]